MANVDEILKSIQEEMNKYEAQYTAVCEDIRVAVKEYNEKIQALQEEGNTKVAQLEAKREQLRGMYTSLYNQYHKFVGDGKDTVTVNPTDEDVQTPNAQKESLDVNSVSKKKSKSSTKSVLSEEDKAKIAQITSSDTKDNDKDKNGNEIPEYLRNEYNK